MVGNRELFLGDGLAVLMLDETGGVTDALDDALGDGVAGLGVDELVLDGGGTGVNDENGGRGHAFAFRVVGLGEKDEAGARLRLMVTGPRGLVPVQPWAWTAVRATVLTMSSTRAPRDRSLTGLLRPCSTGPTASAPEERWTAL